MPDGTFTLRAADEAAQLQLRLESAKPFVIHGENGISQKADGVGRASHYYSGTRLATNGTLGFGGKSRSVHGESWLDREWGSNQLAPNQAGWDWFSLQFTDGTELMLYQMRTKGRGLDPNSSGTFIDQNGARAAPWCRDDYQLTPAKYWTSKSSGVRYPVGWQLTVPKLGLRVRNFHAPGRPGTGPEADRLLGRLGRSPGRTQCRRRPRPRLHGTHRLRRCPRRVVRVT